MKKIDTDCWKPLVSFHWSYYLTKKELQKILNVFVSYAPNKKYVDDLGIYFVKKSETWSHIMFNCSKLSDEAAQMGFFDRWINEINGIFQTVMYDRE